MFLKFGGLLNLNKYNLSASEFRLLFFRRNICFWLELKSKFNTSEQKPVRGAKNFWRTGIHLLIFQLLWIFKEDSKIRKNNQDYPGSRIWRDQILFIRRHCDWAHFSIPVLKLSGNLKRKISKTGEIPRLLCRRLICLWEACDSSRACRSRRHVWPQASGHPATPLSQLGCGSSSPPNRSESFWGMAHPHCCSLKNKVA